MTNIKRLNYFDAQFLGETDFTDEQTYHLEMRRRHNRLLHSWGVADGGFPTTKSGDKTILVGAGTAIDKDGREIVLLDPTKVDLPGSADNQPFYVTARYDDETWEKEDLDSATRKYRRRTEKPMIEVSKAKPAADGSVILLAEVKLAANGAIDTINDAVRKPAGPSANADVVVRSLTVTNASPLKTPAGANTLDLQRAERTNPAKHPTDLALYVTATSEDKLVEFRHSNGTQGIGFRYSTIYATGSNEDQGLTLKARGKSSVTLASNTAVNGALTVENIATFKMDLTVEGDTTVKKSLTVEGDTTVKRSLTVEGDTTVKKGLTVEGDTTVKNGLTVEGDTTVKKSLTVEGDTTVKKGLTVEGDTTVKKSLTVTGAAAWKTGAGVNTVDVQRAERSDYAGTGWKGDHPTDLALYVTADSGDANKLVEFRHSNGTQGIGFGCNTIYATGPYPDQPLRLKAFGKGRVEIQQQDWIEIQSAGAPKFQNGWTNYEKEFNTAAFFKDSLGIVHLRGLVQGSTLAKAIFQLPEGYRPAAQELRIVPTRRPEIPGVAGEYDFGRMDIAKTGDVLPTAAGIGQQIHAHLFSAIAKLSPGEVGQGKLVAPPFVYWVSLDGISFRAA
jgi:cytoskeletal protein CcmA (bactofilin family)